MVSLVDESIQRGDHIPDLPLVRLPQEEMVEGEVLYLFRTGKEDDMKGRVLVILVILALLFVSVAAGGCPPPQTPPPQPPEFKDITHQLGSITEETAEIITTILVYNPNVFILPVKRLETELFIAGINIGQGEAEELELKAEGEFPLTISTIIQMEPVWEALAEHIRHGEVSQIRLETRAVFDLVVIEFTLPVPPVERVFETDLLGSFKGVLEQVEATEITPFGENVPFKMVIEDISITWGEINKETLELRLAKRVRNDTMLPITISRGLVEATLNEELFGQGRLAEQEYKLPAKSGIVVDVIVSLDNKLLVGEFMSHPEDGKKSVFAMNAWFVVDMSPHLAEIVGKERVEIRAFEISGKFEVGFLEDLLGGL